MGNVNHDKEARMVRNTPERDFVTKQRYAEAANRARRVIRGIERPGDKEWLAKHAAAGRLIVLGKRKLTYDGVIRAAQEFATRKSKKGQTHGNESK